MISSRPPRRTRTMSAESLRRESIDRSARPSWKVPMRAFMKTTNRMTNASPRCSITAAITAATKRI